MGNVTEKENIILALLIFCEQILFSVTLSHEDPYTKWSLTIILFWKLTSTTRKSSLFHGGQEEFKLVILG